MNTLTKHEIELIVSRLKNELEPTMDTICPSKKIAQIIKSTLGHLDLSDVDKDLNKKIKYSLKLLKTPHGKFSVKAIYSICTNKYGEKLQEDVYYILGLIFYNALLNKYIPYCNDLLLSKARQEIRSSNLFKKYDDLKVAVKHFSVAVSLRQKSCDILEIVTRIYELRHRIAQSLKSLTAMYYYLYKNQSKYETTNYDQLVDAVVRKIAYYGIVHIPDQCTDYKDEFIQKLPEVDDDLLRASIYEIFSKIGISASRQKIVASLKTLNYAKEVLIEIGLNSGDIKALYCYVQTIYRTSSKESGA